MEVYQCLSETGVDGCVAFCLGILGKCDKVRELARRSDSRWCHWWRTAAATYIGNFSFLVASSPAGLFRPGSSGHVGAISTSLGRLKYQFA